MKNIFITVFILLFVGHFGYSQESSKTAKLKEAERLAWWMDAKFGLFVHWGIYSEAGGEWKGVPSHAEWIMLKSKIPLKEYTEYAKTFNPVDFNADEWVSIVKNAGMKYIVITAKHHDGFAMFNSAFNDYNIVKGTAFKRDPLKELSIACQKQGIRFCVYYSLGRDWEDPDVPTGKGKNSGWRSNLVDYPDESKKDLAKYLERKVKPQIRELLTNYGPIGIFWFDTYELVTTEQGQSIVDLIHSIQPNCIINNRVGPGLGDYSVSEGQIPTDATFKPWETCMTLNGHWGYYKTDDNWKSYKELLQNLIDISSKGGNFLLNVGPTGKGVIPQPSVERLAEIGKWMKVNGEAIYGTTYSPFGKFEWGRCTKKEDKENTTLYFSVFNWPENGKLVIPNLKNKVIESKILTDNKSIKTAATDDGLQINLPLVAPDSVASVLKITVKGKVNNDFKLALEKNNKTN